MHDDYARFSESTTEDRKKNTNKNGSPVSFSTKNIKENQISEMIL